MSATERPIRLTLTFVRGDTFRWRWRWLSEPPGGGTRTPLDLTGYQCRLTVRRRDTDAVILSATQADGIALNAGGTLGVVEAVRGPLLTAALPTGEHHWDQEFTRPDGSVVTMFLGPFLILPDQSR